jgi:hypothetical protein
MESESTSPVQYSTKLIKNNPHEKLQRIHKTKDEIQKHLIYT